MVPRDDRPIRRLWGLVALAGLLVGCNESPGPLDTTETHWLDSCLWATDCGAPYTCHCGVCTIACSDAADCAATDPEAACHSVDEQTCHGAEAAESTEGGGYCLVDCSSDDDCREWGHQLSCLGDAGQSPDGDAGESPDRSPDETPDAAPDETPDMAPCEDGYEPNDVIEDAQQIHLPFGCIEPAGDVDVFFFETVSYSDLSIDVNGISAEMSFDLVVEHADSGFRHEGVGSLNVEYSAPGIHYLWIESASTGPYMIEVRVAPQESEPNDEFDEADRLPWQAIFDGCIEPAGDRDVFEPPEFPMEDTLYVETEDEVVITVHDDSPDHARVAGPGSLLEAVNVTPGVYYIAIEAAEPLDTPCYTAWYH